MERFVTSYHDQLRWMKPTGASMVFVCIIDARTRLPLDDASYCVTLLKETGLLLVPGGKTFVTEGDDYFKGYIHVGLSVAPEKFERALKIWGEYLDRYDQYVLTGIFRTVLELRTSRTAKGYRYDWHPCSDDVRQKRQRRTGPDHSSPTKILRVVARNISDVQI